MKLITYEFFLRGNGFVVSFLGLNLRGSDLKNQIVRAVFQLL
ncbi:hypothetical protein ADICYQ_1323 [Cyclobacterium qasimii M12-11B]|uniref:Uncharacterized protein n=1 Tax=Cyclobacterium qasimii M12-11B TaxID=641524 RepID=S7X043_9BACT|nr:hypothetical protein ADICYQ_1323 [Cyclobacterium qasimii M12-11B]